MLPENANLLNTGKDVRCVIERKPYEKESFLWVQDLLVNELSNEIPVLKLEFTGS